MMKETTFFEAVYEIVRLIPAGRVTSYGAIAAALGSKKSARMVGWAMNSSHGIHPPVPAHRVVNRKGLLTGFMHFETAQKMKNLLESEGIQVKENQVQNFEKILWDPLKELENL